MKRHRIIHTALTLLACLLAWFLPSHTTAYAVTPVPPEVMAFLESRKPSIMEFERTAGVMVPASADAAQPDIRDMQKTYYVGFDDVDRLTIVPSDEWTAAIYHGSIPTGTATAWRDESGTLVDGQSTDAELAHYLTRAAASDSDLVLIQEEHAWFLRKGGMMTPLNEAAIERFPTAVSEREFLDALQPIFVESRKLAREAERKGAVLVGSFMKPGDLEQPSPVVRLAIVAAILVLPGVAAILVSTIQRKKP